MSELRVTRLRDDAVLPARAHASDAGLDLSACEEMTIGPGERALVPTGLAVEIPADHAGIVAPRSGLALRHGISIVNTPGVIDAGYRGEVQVLLLNTDRSAGIHGRAGDAHRAAPRHAGDAGRGRRGHRAQRDAPAATGGFGSSGVR